MEENTHDMLERIESLVPEYSYSSIEDIVRTDEKIREFLLERIKEIKDRLFHVVQISYELERDKLSEIAEGVWEDADILLDRVENSRTSSLKGDKKCCEECKERIDKDIHNLIRRDRQLLLAMRDMRRIVHFLYNELLEKGRESQFIKSADQIKKYAAEITALLQEREKSIFGEGG
jgi:hypothetical protein